ncbi:MAG TPA: phosphonate ABC transporter, permease protein PhnE [Candidatus Limnocylindrales bacterium]|nr:phosphonate ABC transporter, permease protein PhnE [Candidatus Limnocylindrales bacterium]
MTAATAARSASRPVPPSRLRRHLALLGLLVVIAWAALGIDVDLEKLVRLPGGVLLIVHRMFVDPGLDFTYLETALIGMLQSIEIAWVGTVIAAILSLPIGFVAAKNVSSGPISNAIRVLLDAIRAFPELVLAVAIFIPIAGLGPVAGALAIGIHSIGTLGKLTAEVIEGIDAGPVEAARSVGGSTLQVHRWAVLPQVLPEIVAFWLYRFEINIRGAAVLGVVGAGGIGFLLQQTVVYGRFGKAGMALVVVIVATILVDTVSGWVRRRIIEGGGTRRAIEAELEQPELVEGI